MATGFMIVGQWRSVNFTRHIIACLCCLSVSLAGAAEVGLAGLFPGKVLLTINGGAPRIVAVGATTPEGVRVVSVEGETATLEVEGKKRVLRVGQNVASQASSGPATVVLSADSRGHFVTSGMINGKSVRFLVDTGASTIALGAGDARRIGIDPAKGKQGYSQTANGITPVSLVTLDSVRIGDITVSGVEATVHQHDLPVTLLGMSFLNRMEMQRDGQHMTLKKRF